MAHRKEDSEYQKGYVDGQSTTNSNALLGILIGLLVVAVVGGGAWFVFAIQKSQSPQEDTDIINVPAPEAPDIDVNVPTPEAPELPDVNINIPEPKLEVPDVKTSTPSSEGSGDSGSSGSGAGQE